MNWEQERHAWPNGSTSRFVDAGGLRWHVQVAGDGPVVLLVHGTGASTHSWRAVLPELARRHRVVAADLPGQGFTRGAAPSDLSIDGIARHVARLLNALGLAADHAVGHSAGAAILARMALDGLIAPRRIVAINGAFRPFGGAAHALFAPLARLLAGNAALARFLAGRAGDPGTVRRLVEGTGSRLDAAGLAWYAKLAGDPAHVAAALGMMSRWDLHALARDLPRLAAPLTLLVGSRDRAVPPAQADWVRQRLPAAEVRVLPGLGHLAHEEDPRAVCAILRQVLAPDAA
jgi:magnesium chelatase accessory protein